MIFVPVIIVIALAIIFSPTKPRRGRRRKQKGLISMMLDGQKQTEKKNGSHRGVMCGPGGSKKKRWY